MLEKEETRKMPRVFPCSTRLMTVTFTETKMNGKNMTDGKITTSVLNKLNLRYIL